MFYKIIGLMLIITFCSALIIPPAAYPQATLYIGDGSGDPGSCATPLEVSLQNATVGVKGVSMDICEPGNTLVRLGCDTTVRTPAYAGGSADFNCVSNELANGCVRILLFSSQGNLIEPGSGPVFVLQYGVFEEAGPAGSCIELRAENVLVAGEGGPLSSVGILPGQFCYFECSVDEDCNDAAYCNGVEACVVGACQPGVNPCPDDGLFCTGVEGCDEAADACTQSGNPCKISCDEANDVCLCSIDDDCDDGRFCNGVETCNGTICLPGTSPCPPSSICDEANDLCVECVYDSDCDDGLFCNGAETCVSGSCQAAAAPCPPLATCDETNDACLCTDNAQCDDGRYCNGVERCLFNGTCDITFSYFSDYPCKDCEPVTLDDCDCDEGIDACVPVDLTVGNGSGLPGTNGATVAVSLETMFVDVNNITLDVCDTGDFLTCTGCSITGRTPAGFTCLYAEQADGCCRITLIDLGGGVIKPGAGPVFNLSYTVDAGAPTGECRTLTVQNETVATSNVPLSATVTPGQFCFDSGFLGASVSSGVGGNSFLSSSSVADISVGDGSLSSAREGEDLGGGTGQESSHTQVDEAENCPFAASVEDQEQLNTLRTFRDTVLSKNIFGQIFTHLFYRNAPELTEILKRDDAIKQRLTFLVDEYSSIIGEVNEGEKAYLWESDAKTVVDLLNNMKLSASPQLKADIDLVIEEIIKGDMAEIFGITVEK